MSKEATARSAMKLALEQRITDYLSGGGLFNPELADHIAVRDLLIECRQALAEQPAQRTWVGLTDEELSEVYNQADWDTVNGWEYERAIEAKLKEKNT